MPRGRHRVLSAKPDEAPYGDPPPAWVGARDNRQPPPPPQPPQKGTPARRVGDIVPCRAAMNRHGPTTGDTRPPPPPCSRGAPVVPRAGSNPPPPSRSGRPRGPSPSPRGPLRIRPRASTALQPLPPPAAALGPAHSPTRRPTHLGAQAQPAPPVSLRRGPSRSGSSARGRCGTLPASTRIRPRGWCSAGFVPAERGAGPIAVRSPPVTSSALGSQADFGQPRPRTRYGRPHGDAWRPSALTPFPPSTHAHAPPTLPPPLSPHTPPLPPGLLPSFSPHRCSERTNLAP